MMRRLGLALGIALALIGAAGMAAAQQGGPFAPRMIVNDKAITNYEVEQRIRFLRLLGNPPDIEKVALDGLLDDRLRLAEAERLGIGASEEDIRSGMEEFASRANLDVEQFLAAIGQAGVAPETFRDFVKAGIAWRQVVRARFGPRAQITEAEIDRALAITSPRGAGAAQVLMAEIILRADTPQFRAEAERLARELQAGIRSEDAFSAAARRYSVSQTRGAGGRMGWLPLAALPPQIRGQVLTLGPGEVSAPVDLTNAIALFQLRAIREGGDTGEPQAVALEYARFAIPGGTLADAMKVRARVDTCDDLYGVARGLPEDRLLRETRPVAEVAQDVALELAKLDEGEVSYGLSTPDTAVVLMLCGRTPDLGEETLDRDTVRRQLLNQRLGGYAESYLAELKSDAIIREP